MKKIITAIIVLVLLGVFWYVVFPTFKKVHLDEPAPIIVSINKDGVKSEALGIVTKVDMVPSAHDVKGTLSLIEGADRNLYLRFEDFEIINGPDLRVYMSKDLEAHSFIDLGPLKATEGNFNSLIPDTVHIEEYSKVLIWCKGFETLFSYADLKKKTNTSN